MDHLLRQGQRWLDQTQALNFLAPLVIRLYLAPIMWMAGTKKLSSMESTIAWFGNPDWGLGLPFPELLAWLVALLETGGAIMLLCGIGVRLIAIPLMLIMVIAGLTVHWDNGWLAIAESDGFFSTERTQEAAIRLGKAKSLLKEYGNYNWLTGKGSLVILNNGIEFAATTSFCYSACCLVGLATMSVLTIGFPGGLIHCPINRSTLELQTQLLDKLGGCPRIEA